MGEKNKEEQRDVLVTLKSGTEKCCLGRTGPCCGRREPHERAQAQLSHEVFTLGWPKVRLVFFCVMALEVLVVFNFIQNNFVRLYCDSWHICMHLKNYQNW